MSNHISTIARAQRAREDMIRRFIPLIYPPFNSNCFRILVVAILKSARSSFTNDFVLIVKTVWGQQLHKVCIILTIYA